MPNGLIYLKDKNQFENCSMTDAVRYLKGIYTNKDRFVERFLKKIKKNYSNIYSEMLHTYDKVKSFSFKEAFAIKEVSFRSLVFGSINIQDMIIELGAERVSVKGMPVKRKQYNKSGEFLGFKEYDNVYELYKINGKKLGVSNPLFAVKCWCTTTNKEHYVWVESKYAHCPLEAISSTFRIHENLIPHIKELKRQGDILLVEMEKEVLPHGNIIPLSPEQYFSLLTAES